MATLRAILRKQYEFAKHNGWLQHFADAAAEHGVAACDLLGVASRESNLKNIKGDFHDGRYHGYSLMQLDTNSHRAWIESGKWQDVRQAIFKGAEALAEKREQIIRASKQKSSKVKFRSGKVVSFTPRTLNDAQLRRCMIAAYNCGGASYYHFSIGNDTDAGTTGKNYSEDVIERAAIFQDLLRAEKRVEPKPPTLDLVPSPVKEVSSEPSNGNTVLSKVKNHISSDSVKLIAGKGAAKAVGPLAALWATTGGKVLVIGVVVIIVAVIAYEGYRHRARVKEFIGRIGK